MDGWSSASGTVGGGSAMENSRVTSLPQKVQAGFKIEEATCALGGAQRPGQEISALSSSKSSS